MQVLGPIIGAAVGGGLNYLGTKQQNEFNRDFAHEQMNFQERMSSTAYQRAMHDMKEAGLNPMLAFQQGGASSPSGSTGFQAQNALGNAVSSALEFRRLFAELNNLEAQNKKLKAETDLTKTNAKAAKTTIPGLEVEEKLDRSLYGALIRALQRLNPIRGAFKK